MNIKSLFRALLVALCGLCLPLYGHHSVSVFDTSKPILLKGFIAEVRFANPHSSIFIDVEDESGQKIRWAVENSGPLYVTRQLRGFDETKLQVGDPIEVCGFAPKRPYSTVQELKERGESVPVWWGDAKKFITSPLLILKDGAAENWGYGPLEVCQALLGLK